VNSDNQTLILAGEAIPRRAVASFARKTSAAVGDGENTLLPSSYLSSTRGASFTSANEYARTQNLSGNGIRTAIIDTYA
jgi:hypothetical protein